MRGVAGNEMMYFGNKESFYEKNSIDYITNQILAIYGSLGIIHSFLTPTIRLYNLNQLLKVMLKSDNFR